MEVGGCSLCSLAVLLGLALAGWMCLNADACGFKGAGRMRWGGSRRKDRGDCRGIRRRLVCPGQGPPTRDAMPGQAASGQAASGQAARRHGSNRPAPSQQHSSSSSSSSRHSQRCAMRGHSAMQCPLRTITERRRRVSQRGCAKDVLCEIVLYNDATAVREATRYCRALAATSTPLLKPPHARSTGSLHFVTGIFSSKWPAGPTPALLMTAVWFYCGKEHAA
ncbi:hypothetical protein BDZ91DRAFT_763000 [Kalaharituber pfeilii]|nr:hypothetical protein BDZ91DRAFT_763000 [Kalaharituber pfeilii]